MAVVEGRVQITDESVDMHRQVSPAGAFWQEGEPSSLSFQPNSGDKGELSLSDGRNVNPEQAYEAHIDRGHSSAGVLTLKVGIFHQHNITVWEDSLSIQEGDPHDDPTHSIADYKALSKTQQRKVAKKLRREASSWLPSAETAIPD